MTENEKKIAKEIHDEFKIMGLNFAADVVEEKFPEAFAEPKPERVSIDVRIEVNSHFGVTVEHIKKTLTDDYYAYAKEAELTVTELPAPEGKGRFVGYSFYGLDGKLHDKKVSPVPQVKLYDVADESDCKPELNGWTDELVSKFVDEWESYEGKRFSDCMEDFKQKNNVE
jgi:hypothetical protein